MRRVCIVGAGNIARTHAEALRSLPGLAIAAVVDPRIEAARELATNCGGAPAFASVGDALAAGGFEAAHVLVPPDRHAETALPLLKAGIAVLLEKPLGVSGQECAALLEASRVGGAALGVNQNFVFHPAFAELRRLVETRAFGPPDFVDCIYTMPLRQLAARQFGHWMFATPRNILLEQAVHPLSQIRALAGPVTDLRAIAGPPATIAPGVDFHDSVTVTLACERLPAQLRFALGRPFPLWQITVVCADGVIVADMLANRVVTQGRTRWLDASDAFLAARRSAADIRRAAWRNAWDFGLAALGLKPRSDTFYRSMRDSIARFHAAAAEGQAPETDGAFGAGLVETCERIAEMAFARPAAPVALARPVPGAAQADVAVLGGTGFIGQATMRHLLEKGMTVSVMARSTANLPALFQREGVVLRRGDIRDADALDQAIGGARIVVNLAHGGGGASYEQIRAAMVGGAETVARVAQAKGARLIHVGSIASLYLGPDAGTITGATPPDPRSDERADYARAKAECDRMLLRLHAEEQLPVTILRPGLVVGEGTSPFHSGLGLFNNEQHCIGWNAGANPLPFVLVDDVAAAIAGACAAASLDGRCFNLVGDVRPSAREYIAALAVALDRPLRFHAASPHRLWAAEVAKWAIKRAGGRRVPLPSLRDLVSRGLMAPFDCTDAKDVLGWRPEADRASFDARAIRVHA